MNIETEIEIVKAFFAPKKRERYIYFLNSNRREELLEDLYHFYGDFDPNCVVELSRSCNSAEGLLAELHRRGAVNKCYVMSVNEELDGVTEPLEDIIEKVYGWIEGTIVYCAPGTLAYYEGEFSLHGPQNRCILQKRSNNSLQRTAQKARRR